MRETQKIGAKTRSVTFIKIWREKHTRDESMHIKKVIISGFKTYKDQPSIEEFSEKINCIGKISAHAFVLCFFLIYKSDGTARASRISLLVSDIISIHTNATRSEPVQPSALFSPMYLPFLAPRSVNSSFT